MSKTPSNPFRVGDLVVYPAHGVGRVLSVERQEVHGDTIELISVLIAEEGLTLMIPSHRATRSGMRPLCDPAAARRAMTVMTGRPRGKAGTWNRRAQEYDNKINSGDLLLAAEVVRDLRGGGGSYSERQIYARALGRVCSEVGQVLGRDPELIRQEVEAVQEQSAA